jgi:hypothetical protein
MMRPACLIRGSYMRIQLGLALIAIVSIIIPTRPALANPGAVLWSTVDTPTSIDNVIASPSEINSIAMGIDGTTFYAIDIPNSKVYKSSNGGVAWNELSSLLASSGAALPAWNVAIAPDNPEFVAIVTSDGGLPRKVFISTDGGSSWQNANCQVAENIGAIAISPNYGGYDIAIGTRTGAGGGNVYILKSASSGDWVAQGFAGDILSLKFSPGYSSDFSLVTVSARPTGTFINLGIHDSPANTTNWSTWAPSEVATGGAGTSPKVNQIITADIELPADFSGQAPSLRRMYVSLDAPSANAGIYRFDDAACHLLMPATSPLRISSLAYYGTYSSGKLLAGEVRGNSSSASAMTWFTNAPITCAGTCWYQAQKAPTGGGNSGFANTQVMWSPDGNRAYCGTASASINNAADWPSGYLTGSPLDESAFSSSPDNGETWNQLSLIDTEIDFLSDVAVTPASDIIYLASVNNHGSINNFDSIWRTAGSPTGDIWERVLCLLSTSNDLIMRTSNAGNDPSIYVASRSTSDLKQSLDRGQTWTNALPGVNITDFAVTRIDDIPNMYILNSNYVRRGTTNGQTWQWSIQVDTTLGTGHSINATPTRVVVVGDSAGGMVAYSLDEGTSFARTVPIQQPGKMQAIADYRFRNALPLYAASDSAGSEIYYWVVGSNLNWTPMGSQGRGFYGLAQIETLYGAWSSAGNTAVDRTLEPEKLGPPYIEWDRLTAGLTTGVVFTREPSSLKVSAGINLWAIDNRPYTNTTGRLWNFYDCFSPSPQYTPPEPPSHEVLFQAPITTAPAAEDVIPVYLDTGDIGNIEFKWRHPTEAIEYELWLAKDEAFSQIVLKQVIKPENELSPSWTLPRTISLDKGATYYWKMRVIQAETGETGEGQWSKVISFSIASLPSEQISGTESSTATPSGGIPGESEPSTAGFPTSVWIIIALSIAVVFLFVFVIYLIRRR